MDTTREFLIWPNKKYNIKALRKLGVLLETRLCQHCRVEMRLIKEVHMIDGEIFICNVCKKKVSIRMGSIFYKLKLDLHVVFRIIDIWLEEVTIDDASKKMLLSTKTIKRLYKKFRGIISKYFKNCPKLTNKSDKSKCICNEEEKKRKTACKKMVIKIINTIYSSKLIKYIDYKTRDQLKILFCNVVNEDYSNDIELLTDFSNVFDVDITDLDCFQNLNDSNHESHVKAVENVYSHLDYKIRKKNKKDLDNLRNYIDELLWRKKYFNNKEDLINSFLELIKI